MQILENQCFHYFIDFLLQKHAKRGEKLSILGRDRLENPFEKRLEIWFVFFMIFDGFWDDLGRVWGVFWAT